MRLKVFTPSCLSKSMLSHLQSRRLARIAKAMSEQRIRVPVSFFPSFGKVNYLHSLASFLWKLTNFSHQEQSTYFTSRPMRAVKFQHCSVEKQRFKLEGKLSQSFRMKSGGCLTRRESSFSYTSRFQKMIQQEFKVRLRR